MTRIGLILLAALLLAVTATASVHHEKPVTTVLLLHSYHHGFAWSDTFTEGVREQLVGSDHQVHLDIHYLDEKHTSGRRLWPNIRQILEYKYEVHPPDIILAVDDAALHFLLDNNDLFPEAPVVFGGVSHFEALWREQRPLLTGVTERAAIAETVQLALELQPEIDKVVVVNDSSLSGVQRHVQAVLALEPLWGKVATEHWIDMTIGELDSRLRRLDASTMVLFCSYYRDSRDVVFSGQEVGRLADQASRGPIYAVHDPMLGEGVVGGVVNRGEAHGRLVAQMALRVLDGIAISGLPVMTGPAIPRFDHEQLQRYGIDQQKLPGGSQVFNRPQSFVSRHVRLFEMGAFLFVILLGMHAASIVLLRVRRRAEETLKQNYKLLQTIMDSIPDPIFYKDREGKYLGGNQAFLKAIGGQNKNILGKTIHEITPTALAEKYHREDLDLIESGGSENYETQIRFADGKVHDVLFQKATFPGEEGEPAGMVGAMLDITERKAMENRQSESEEQFRTLFETSPDPIILSEMDGTIIDVNQGFVEQAGISREKALGKNSLELEIWKKPEDREHLLSSLRATGVVHNLRFDLQTHRGQRRGLFSARIVEFSGRQRMLFVVRDITEIVRTEAALEQSELRLRTVFDASPDAILISRAGGGGIIDVNDGFTRLWGFEREEVLWRSTNEVGLWADMEQREILREKLHREQRVDNFEIDILCKDGTIRITSASCRLVELEGHLSTLAVFRDITAYKASERALRESEGKFHAVFNQTFQLMGILDPQGRVLHINDVALEMYELTQEEVFGKFFWDTAWWQGEGQRELIQLAVDTASRGNLFQVRNTHTLHDGSKVHVDFSLKPVRDASGEICYLIPEGRDITGLYVAEQALRESELRYRGLTGQFQTALNGVPDMMMIFDVEGKLIWGNQSAEKTFSLSEDDYTHTTCRQIWGEKPMCMSCQRDTFLGGEPWEELIEPGDGLSWGVKTFPIKDAEGKVFNVLQIATDLTEKIRLREQASRSAHLAALGEVAAGVAHEINNPVGLMQMDLGMLHDVFQDLIPVIENYRHEHGDFEAGGLRVERVLNQVPLVFDELRDGASRIKRIVEELKDFASPHAEVMQQSVDLNDAVQRALRLTRKTLDNCCEKLDVELDAKLPQLNGNTQRLEQVVINLLLNAAHALDERGGQIKVATDYNETRHLVTVTVTDNGCGIPEEKLKLITDPFFTTRREDGGTGLGLSVSSRIIDEHRGSLSFSSQPGEGTTVTIELPVPPEEDGDA